ncbi:MAG: plastocyanin/azurin family copper-binding protein [Acidiferrobacterales bacterium]|nr:plastocyanin/azurin family copper-binding protein [Acidiferrobacterales bacterium]
MRTKLTLFWTATAVAVAVSFAASLSNTIKAGEPPSQRHVVQIRNLQFVPEQLSVVPGDTITWVNHDLVPHTVTADDESWDSGLIGAQGHWQILVQAHMYTTYFCRYHPSMTAQLRLVRR